MQVTFSEVQCQHCHRYLFASETTCGCRAMARRDRLVKIAEVGFAIAWLGVILGWRVWEVVT